MEIKKAKSIIELMIPYYRKYNQIMMEIVSEALKHMKKPNDIKDDDQYNWDTQKKLNENN